MSCDVTVQVRDARWKALLRPHGKTVRTACAAALREVAGDRCQVTEMTIVLADDAFIQELNRTYRGKDKATNVLSFSNPTPDTRHPSPDAKHLGDIVLALETIEREAREQEKAFKNHATHLLVHGTLHLLGYDHEREKDAARMEALEIKILGRLGISNPYL